MSLLKPISCPFCKKVLMPDNFCVDMFKNYDEKIVTLNQCDGCKSIWTD